MSGSYPGEYSAGRTWELLDPDSRCGEYNVDDDGDQKIDERDEGDAIFTWYANLFTTRNSVFTIEIIAELTEPPYHPGYTMTQHRSYTVNSSDIHARKHLLAVLDRSDTLHVASNGECDFTRPVKVLVLRWAQLNK